MRIGIVGHFGYGNLGDELFLKHWENLLKNKAEVFPVCLDASLDFDKIIIGGGDLGNISVYNDLFWSFRYLEKPCFIYGVGCRHEDGDRNESVMKKFSLFTNMCYKVLVRDEWSFELMKSFGCKVDGVVRDLLWNFDLKKLNNYDKKWSECVGLSLRQEYKISERQIDFIFEESSKKGFGVKLLPHQSQTYLGNDYEIHNRLLSRSNGWISPYANTIYRANACGWCKILISTRIHATIMAVLQKTPVIPLYVGEKNRFSYICEILGIKAINKQDWNRNDFSKILDIATKMDWDLVWKKVDQLKYESNIEQLEFIKKNILDIKQL